MKNITNTGKILFLAIMAIVMGVSNTWADEVKLYSLTEGIGTAEVTAADATVNAGTSLVLTNSAGRIKITPATGYKFQNGDVISFSGTVGNTSKNYGLKIFASNGSTQITSGYVAGTAAATGTTITLSLTSDQDYIYIGRFDGTATTMTSFTVTREASTEELGTRYTVSFNANTNGTCSTSSLTEASEGAGVTLPTATANYGYNFLGWSTSSTATTASYSAGATYKPSTNTTLYAIYEIDENAPVLPAAGSSMTFDATKRYSEWVINSRINDFYGNETYYGFYSYDTNGNQIANGSTSTQLDYVPGLVAKAVIEAVDYYKDSKDVDVNPWYYSVQRYANNTIKSDGKNGKSFDDLNAVKLYFKLKELASSGSFADANDSNINNAASISTANTRLSEALAGIKTANRDYAISESLLPGAAGGWWHKSSYTNQMWCDGQYMGPALLAQMLNEYDNYESDGYIAGSKSDDWDLVTKQFTISWNYLWNPEVKLLYHAFTADPECTANTNASTNASKWAGFPNSDGIYHSAEYWGRAEGWYFLALVDVLEQMQIAGLTRTENYKTLHGYLNLLADGIAAKQDATTGCWYQLLNHDDTFVAQNYDSSYRYTSSPVANYLESSASAIFTAAYLKGMRLGLYDTDYTEIAKKAYKGIVENFMVADGNGGVHLIACSKSAGVGGSNYRDGSAEYYLMGKDTKPTAVASTPATPSNNKASNDFYTEGKVFGGFILAATEYERLFMDKKLELTDAHDYDKFPAGEYDEVTLTRNIPAGEWSSLMLPFDVTATQMSETFADGSVVAVAKQLDSDKLYIKTQDYINANVPVFIKLTTKSADDTYTFKGVTVTNSAVTDNESTVKLVGSYVLLTGGLNGDLDATDYFVYDNKLYDCSYLSVMKPFRAYLSLPSAAGAKEIKLDIFEEDDETTGVKSIALQKDDSNGVVYNIIGQRVNAGSKGLLLQNRRKIVVN